MPGVPLVPSLPGHFLNRNMLGLALAAVMAVVLVSLALGLLFELVLDPGVAILGHPGPPLNTHGCLAWGDWADDNCADLLVGVPESQGQSPRLQIVPGANPDKTPVLLDLPGLRLLPGTVVLGQREGPGWLFALSTSPDSTVMLLNAFHFEKENSPPRFRWTARLPIPPGEVAEGHPHLVTGFLEPGGTSCWLELEHASHLHELLGVSLTDSLPRPTIQSMPSGFTLNNHAGLTARDGSVRFLLQGIRVEGSMEPGPRWSEQVALFDPRSGRMLRPDWAHEASLRARPLPDGRHLLIASQGEALDGKTTGVFLWDSWDNRVARRWSLGHVDDICVLPSSGPAGQVRLLALRKGDLLELEPEGGGASLLSTPKGLPMDAAFQQGWLVGGFRTGNGWLSHPLSGRLTSFDFQGSGHVMLAPHSANPLDVDVFILTDNVVRGVHVESLGLLRRVLAQPVTGLSAGLGLLAMVLLAGLRHRQRGMLLLSILEDDSNAVALKDPEGRLLFANLAFRRLLAAPECERLTSILDAEDPAEGSTIRLEGRWIRLLQRPVHRGSRLIGTLHFGVDETALREADEGRRFRSLTGLISHELKTPMTPLRLGLDQILREVERLQAPAPESLQRVLSRMRSDLDNMSRLLRQFMAMAGEQRTVESLDLREAVGTALQRTGVLQLPFVRCECSLPERPAWVQGNPEMLTMVLSGLLANALEAMGRKGRLAITLDYQSSIPGASCWLLTIQDEGRGIAENDLPRVWDPGFSTHKDGYGYGLYFARNTVLDMQGQISLEVVPSGGLLVNISLPAFQPPRSAEATAEIPAAGEEEPG